MRPAHGPAPRGGTSALVTTIEICGAGLVGLGAIAAVAVLWNEGRPSKGEREADFAAGRACHQSGNIPHSGASDAFQDGWSSAAMDV